MKNRFLILLFLLAFSISFSQTKYQKDFTFFWNTMDKGFAYFDTQKTNWNRVKEIYQPIIDTTTSKQSFIITLEKILYEVYNGHLSLNIIYHLLIN